MGRLGTFLGSAICAAGAFAVWPELWKSYGIMGGWLAAVLIIGTMWYLNHYLGMIDNPAGGLWIDQGWAIGTGGIAWAVVRFGGSPLRALPTLMCCLAGGALAGYLAARVETARDDAAGRARETAQKDGVKS